jgi:CheY-like chemotaxis protein
MAKTILVADDNPIIRKVICEIFTQQEDYLICAACSNGQEAIDSAIKHKPALIILDLSMPVMNGVEAAQKLKKIMPQVPIILFTQYGHFDHNGLAGEHLFDRIVSKVECMELLGHVRSLIPV